MLIPWCATVMCGEVAWTQPEPRAAVISNAVWFLRLVSIIISKLSLSFLFENAKGCFFHLSRLSLEWVASVNAFSSVSKSDQKACLGYAECGFLYVSVWDKYGCFAHLLSVFLVISERGKNQMPILLVGAFNVGVVTRLVIALSSNQNLVLNSTK